MADVQTENGFTKIAHELLEAVQMFKFSLNEIKIIMAVWRFTYGFNRKEHAMSLTFLMNHTGLNRSRVNDSVKKLIEYNVLIVTKKGNAKSSNSYSFNKDYDSWTVEKYSAFASNDTGTSVQIDTSTKTDTSTSVQIDTSTKTDTSTSVQNDTGTSVQIDTQEIYLKDISKDSSNSDKVLPENFFLQNIRRRGFTVSPFERQNIEQMETHYGYDLLMAAMKVTAKNGADNIGYVEGVLTKWEEAGVKTIEQAREFERQFKERITKKKGVPKSESKDIFAELERKIANEKE